MAKWQAPRNRIGEPFRLVEANGVEVVRCDLLAEQGLPCHGITTRQAPSEPLARLARRASGLDGAPVAQPEQVHGDAVACIGPPGVPTHGSRVLLGAADALITREPGVLLVMSFADCVPVFLYDPHTRALGLVHAGWRGTARGIAGKAVGTMGETFGTRPGDCLAAVGPSIGPCCYEVGADVAAAILESCSDDGVVRRDEQGRLCADLRACNAAQLLAAGVRAANLHVSAWCTACNVGIFFSHRAEKRRAGRMAAFAALV
jgi:YfiH family protein